MNEHQEPHDNPQPGPGAPTPGHTGPTYWHSGQGSGQNSYRPGGQGQPNSTDRFFNSIRQLGIVRTEERWVGGVAGGVAKRFGLDPLLVRGLLAASLLLVGTGLVLYAIGWALLPEERDGRIHFEEMIRGNFDGALIGAGVAFIAGIGWGGISIFPFSHMQGWFGGFLWLAATGGIIAVIVIAVHKQKEAGERPTSSWAQPHQEGASSMYATETTPNTYDHAPAPDFPASPVPPSSGPIHPERPKPPRVHSAGVGLVSAVLGLWALATAGLLLADRAGTLDAPVLLVSLALLAGLAGLGIIIAGLRGRTSGGLGALAIIAILLAGPASLWPGNAGIADAARGGFGDAVFEPTSVRDAEKGFAVVAGDWELDLTGLTDLPARGAEPITVPVTMAASSLTIRMPADVAWSTDVRLAAGEVSIETPTASKSRSGVLIRDFHESERAATAEPVIELAVHAAAGEITILEEKP